MKKNSVRIVRGQKLEAGNSADRHSIRDNAGVQQRMGNPNMQKEQPTTATPRIPTQGIHQDCSHYK